MTFHTNSMFITCLSNIIIKTNNLFCLAKSNIKLFRDIDNRHIKSVHKHQLYTQTM